MYTFPSLSMKIDMLLIFVYGCQGIVGKNSCQPEVKCNNTKCIINYSITMNWLTPTDKDSKVLGSQDYQYP